MKPHQYNCASISPILYLRHFVDRETVTLSLNDVEEENEDEGIDGVDDDSVEDAFEASVLTEAVLKRDRDLVGNEDDDVFSLQMPTPSVVLTLTPLT
ncbi:hypothetical protein IV203_011055 [Nitzschia inconspicua]|uniref:Uncharacterized protein n=1 Tax=Nitzschia inconspicua TaxID=303405 RepID=A0A9K3P8H8_9STRA|nr:hypothetical protein IV203_011055 [Nitzschia inconspicua]